MASAKKVRKRIVVLGGGFAGLSAALQLDPERHRVTLVDRRRWFEFLPNIHELLSEVKTPELLRLPLDQNLQQAGHRFLRGTVTHIDPEARCVMLERRERAIPYDALVVALGGVNATHGVSGVEEHALPFKSVAQCARIGKRLAELTGRRRPARVVIVGGGLEGVEALGEILRRYRDSGMQVCVVEAGERLLPEAPAVLDPQLRELCAPYRVAFEVRARVSSIEARSVLLGDGRTLPSDLTIWTGGPAPSPLLADCGLAPPGRWAAVDVTLQSKGHPRVFVAGDAAELPTPIPKQGYHALDMGVCAAKNAERCLAREPLEPFRPSGKPMLISLGDLSCFLVAGERVLAGAALGAAKEAVYSLLMAQLDREPWWRQGPRAAQRAQQAARELLWPSVSSPAALRRQGRVSLLAG